MIDRICLSCGCYDYEYGCTMSGFDMSPDCPLYSDLSCNDLDESE